MTPHRTSEQKDLATELLRSAARARRAFGGRPGGLEPRAIEVLVAIWTTPERAVTRLADELGIDRSTVSHAIRALAEAGLLANPGPGADARSRVYRVSARGERLVLAILADTVSPTD